MWMTIPQRPSRAAPAGEARRPGVLDLVAALAAVLSLCGAAAPERPNIVVILADDLGWADLGCYGSEIPTPNVDALAAGGLRFTQFYNNAVCGPSRVSLLTGLYPQQVGHPGTLWNDPHGFDRCVTVGEVLQRAGYRTLAVGKWQSADLPADRGFDRFFGPMCQDKISYFHEVRRNPFYLDRDRWPVPSEGFDMTETLTDHAVRFVEEAAKGGRPFFLYAAYLEPHSPLHAREEEIAPHRRRYRETGWERCRADRLAHQRKAGLTPASWTPAPFADDVPAWGADPNKEWQAERMAVYAAMVARLDRAVGRITQAVQAAGAEENTLVLFLSDNGAQPHGGAGPTTGGFGFEPNLPNDDWRLDRVTIRPGSGPAVMPGPADTYAGYGPAWAHVSNAPFRGAKLTAYEGGIRTPLIARWPAVIEPGGLTSDVGHVMDVLPTCLEIAGAGYPAEFEGRRPLPVEGKSLASLFRGEPRAGHEALYWDAPQNRAVRRGRWKLVDAKRGGSWELYDLETDGTESRDLAAGQPGRIRELAGAWAAWADRCGVTP